ncbi:hypothetical protein EGO51_19085 [Haloarcula hispanica]|uniref:Uncharacterized protein n=1 Tax=Haloarcula hispanica TaxID=51589 RepID=A0A5J5LDJ8_HALHI|nr:hypothetical protein [Haloarcula hispanica]KAA9404604.1 hypothetical protein EGO51_19085 [Haloarcula hispanica]
MSFLIDSSLWGPFTTLALAGAVMATLGAAVSVYTAHSDPDAFDFDDGVPQQLPLPTLVLIMGIGSIVAGLTNLTLAVIS